MNTRRIFVNCMLFRGSFSGEMVFSLDTIDNGEYVGIAPRRDTLRRTDERIEAEEALQESGIEGKLVARLIANRGDIARVALPDGEAVKVSVSEISEREPEIAHVSL